MGNICRSPTAHGVFRHMVESAGHSGRIHIDSCGTEGYHIGDPPDPRARETARHRGLDISDLRARRVARSDFEDFDYILAMDNHNHRALNALCPPAHRGKLHMFLAFSRQAEREVPDPYYTGGFDRVFDMVEVGARDLLEHIVEKHAL